MQIMHNFLNKILEFITGLISKIFILITSNTYLNLSFYFNCRKVINIKNNIR